MYDYLKEIQQKLSEIPGVTSCRIGYEAEISAADFPLIRIVPVKSTNLGESKRAMMIEVFFGLPLYDSIDGQEKIIEELINMESEIKNRIRSGNKYKARWTESLFDDMNQAEAFKLCISRFDVLSIEEY